MIQASLWIRTSGPLAVHVDGLTRALVEQGYAERTVLEHLRLMAHLSRWMASRALASEDLAHERLDQFLEARREAGHTHGLSPPSLGPSAQLPARAGVAPVEPRTGPNHVNGKPARPVSALPGR